MATSILRRNSSQTGRADLGLLATRQRRRRLIPTVAVAVFTLAASFVVFLSLEPKPAGHPVLVLRQNVVAGQQLAASDLTVVTVDAAGISTMRASDLAQVVGKALSVSLPAGSLLSAGLLVGRSGPLPGQAIVGAALKPGAFPPDLAPGARVQVYAGAANPLTGGTVFTLQTRTDGQAEAVVALMVPAKVAGAVSVAAAAGTLTLVWVTL